MRRHLAIAAIALLAALWWSSAADPRTGLCDPDVLYQVQRVARCLADFPHVSTVDRYSHFGREFHIHWMGGYTLLLAGLDRLGDVGQVGAGGSGADLVALIRALSWVPVGMGVIALLLTLRLGRPLLGGGWALLGLAVAVALGGEELAIFGRGELDHNAVAALGVLLLALGRGERRFAPWAIGALLLFTTSPVATGYATLVLGVVFAADLSARAPAASSAKTAANSLPPLLPARFYLAPGVACLVGLLLNRLLDPDPPGWRTWSVFQLSLFQVTWLVALGSGMALALRLLPAGGRPWRRATIAVCLLSALALGLLATSRDARATWSRLTEHRLFVAEELSPLRFGFRRAAPSVQVLVLLAPWIAVGLARAAVQGDTDEVFRRGLLLAAVAAGLAEGRHLRDLSPLITLATVLGALESHRLLTRLSLLSRPAPRALAAGLLALLVVPPLEAHALEVRAGMGACDNVRGAVIPEVAAWMRAATPGPGPRDGGVPAYGVFAAWNVGHHINVLAGRPVVVDPFNHVDTEAITRAVWMATDSRQLVAALRETGARYFVVADAGRVILSLRLEDLSVAGFDDRVPGGMIWQPEMLAYAAFRLWLGQGRDAEFTDLAPRFSTRVVQIVPIADREGRVALVSIPAGQVYEVVP